MNKDDDVNHGSAASSQVSRRNFLKVSCDQCGDCQRRRPFILHLSTDGSRKDNQGAGAEAVGLRSEDYGTHSLRRTKASIIYKATGELRAVQILLGHTKIENTVRYLGVDIEDADSQRERKSDYGGGPRFRSGLPLEQS